MHHIQYSILAQLMKAKLRRFSELKPKNLESNLFQYHLKKLIKDGYVRKVVGGYGLTQSGLYLADHHSFSLKTSRPQPKIITVNRLYSPDDKVLLIEKLTQPFIGTYHLPAGKVHEAETLHEASSREVSEKLGRNVVGGDFVCMVHVSIYMEGELISEYMGAVFDYAADTTIDAGIWVGPAESSTRFAPSVKEILSIPRDASDKLYEWRIDLVD